MPEGPECRIISEELNSVIQNATILNYQVSKPERITNAELLQPNLQIVHVKSYGKKILFQLSNNLYFFTSMHMEGRWRFEMQKHTWIAFHLRLSNNTEVVLSYQDHRRMAKFIICFEVQFIELFNKLGIDILQYEISLEQLMYFLYLHQKKNICSFLLMQEHFSGVGNYLKCDILFASKISPFRACGSLSYNEVQALHYYLHSIPRLSYSQNAITLYTWKSIFGKEGTYQPLVYGRTHTVEGYPVTYEKIQGRDTYFVPEIQL